MAYIGNTSWKQNDIVMPEDMNRIEQGITNLDEHKLDKTANAASATKLQAGRTIGLSGGVTGTPTTFTGEADITIPVTAVDPSKMSSAVPVTLGGTGATTSTQARTNLGVPPTNHASTDTSYGVATGTTFGHVKVTAGNGLAITGGIVSLGAASVSAAGAMSALDKTKLDGVATGAEVNQNSFSNVVVGSSTITADSKTDTLTLTAGNNITLTPDTTNDSITITAKDTTYSNATTSAAGLLSATDKSKLDGVATGANNYTHPTSGVTAGTYRNVTVNAQGHVTAGSNPTVTVAQGGTGATTVEGANHGLTYRDVPPTTDLPYSYPEGIHFYYASTSSGLPYVPSDFGLIFSMRAGTETTQIWYAQPSGNIFRRSSNTNVWQGNTAQRGWTLVTSTTALTVATLEE